MNHGAQNERSRATQDFIYTMGKLATGACQVLKHVCPAEKVSRRQGLFCLCSFHLRMSTPRLPTLGGPPGSNFNVSPRLPRPRANASHESSPRGRRAGRDSKEGKERKHAHFERGERSLPASVSPTEEPTGAASAAEEPSASELPFRKAKFKEIKALAKVFDARLGTRPVEARSVGMFVTWNDLYNHMDSDGSGHVDGGEFEWMVRKELGIHAASLPDVSLRGLFAALDHDGSGFISFGEFAHFMRYYSRRMRLSPRPP